MSQGCRGVEGTRQAGDGQGAGNGHGRIQRSKKLRSASSKGRVLGSLRWQRKMSQVSLGEAEELMLAETERQQVMAGWLDWLGAEWQVGVIVLIKAEQSASRGVAENNTGGPPRVIHCGGVCWMFSPNKVVYAYGFAFAFSAYMPVLINLVNWLFQPATPSGNWFMYHFFITQNSSFFSLKELETKFSACWKQNFALLTTNSRRHSTQDMTLKHSKVVSYIVTFKNKW